MVKMQTQMMKFKDMDDLDIVQKRFTIMFSTRLRERDRIQGALKVQDELRAKSSGSWSGASEIRKCRDQRFSS